MNFNIEKFNPIKKELYDLAENCKAVVASDGKTGYDLIDISRKLLKKKRCEVVKILTDERAITNAYSQAVIGLQKELVGIIEPLEKELAEKQKAVDLEILIEKQKELLPERKKKLEEIAVKLADRDILVMKDKEFEAFYTEKKGEFLAEKERRLQEERAKIEEDKRIEEARRQARIEAEKQAEREAEQAKIRAEQEKQRAIEEEQKKAREEKERLEQEKQEAIRKAEEEKQRIIDEQKRKEAERIAKEEEANRLEAERIEKEKQEKERLEKRKKYINWLKKNGYTEEAKEDFIIKRIESESKFIIYKKIDEIIIK
jgi:hypothetical protein